MKEIFSDDIISIVNRIIDDRIKYLQRYIGIVKEVFDDGLVKVAIPELGIKENNPNAFIFAKQGNKFYSSFVPRVNDKVEIYFKENTIESASYSCLPFQELQKASKDNYVIFEKSNNIFFLFDFGNNLFNIKINDMEIKIKENEVKIKHGNNYLKFTPSKLEINFGTNTTIIDSTEVKSNQISDSISSLDTVRNNLQTLTNQFNALKNAYDVHTHTYVSPAIPSSPAPTSPPN